MFFFVYIVLRTFIKKTKQILKEVWIKTEVDEAT